MTLGFLLLLLVASKPVLDFFWQSKFSLFGRSISPQGLLGIAFFLLSFFIANFDFRNEKNFRQVAAFRFCYAFSMLLILSRLCFKIGDAEMTLRYGASMAALIIIPWSVRSVAGDTKKISSIGALLVFSLVSVIATIILQLLGFLPWQSFDNFFLMQKLVEITKVGRLSGAYFHPLDLVRVLIWPYLLICNLMLVQNQKKLNTIMLFSLFTLWNLVLFLTTHRLSIFLAVTIISLLCWQKKTLRICLQAYLLICLSWLIGGAMIAERAKAPIEKVISVANLTSNPSDGSDASLSISKFATNASRGRLHFWQQHFDWISSFSVLELASGTRRDFPKDADHEAQAHNQLLDLLERFGILGVLSFVAAIILGIWKMQVPPPWKISTLACLGIYSLITEPLFAPTFLWWAVLYCSLPMLFVVNIYEESHSL